MGMMMLVMKELIIMRMCVILVVVGWIDVVG